MRNPKFNALLREMEEIHDRKNADYADDDNPYSNFEFAAQFAGCSVDTVFNVLIGIKQARLNELIGKGKEAVNESIDDTLLDRAVYASLQASYRRAGSNQVPVGAETGSTGTSETTRPYLGSVQRATYYAGDRVLPNVSKDCRSGPDLESLNAAGPRNPR